MQILASYRHLLTQGIPLVFVSGPEDEASLTIELCTRKLEKVSSASFTEVEDSIIKGQILLRISEITHRSNCFEENSKRFHALVRYIINVSMIILPFFYIILFHLI